MHNEPEFVGQSRKLIVDGLIAAFDQVRTTQTPLWVDIQAPSGWGKTRLVREFYKALAAERQQHPHYWPASILESWPDATLDVSTRRKRVYPKVTHTPGSLPDYFWWGITAGTRDPIAALALIADIEQLNTHARYLDDAWRQRVSALQRHRGTIVNTLEQLSETAVDELLAETINTVIGTAVPGVGLITSLVRRAAQWRTEIEQRSRRLLTDEDITTTLNDTAARVAALISKLAVPGLPVIVFIEDAHRADPVLAQLLETLLATETCVLIVTTAWDGYADANNSLRTAQQTHPERIVRLTPDTQPLPSPFPAGASLSPLSAEDRTTIVNHYHRDVDPDTLTALVARYNNPLALELVCELPRYRNHTGPLRLSASDINELPATVKDLYRSLWLELPEDVRRTLAYASLGVPATTDTSNTESLAWSDIIIGESMQQLHDSAALGYDSDKLDQSTIASSWTRRLGQALREFIELDQLLIASQDDAFLSGTQRRELLDTIGQTTEAALRGDIIVSPGDLFHVATLAEALHTIGLVDDDTALTARSLLLNARSGSQTDLDSDILRTQQLLGTTTTPTASGAALSATLAAVTRGTPWGPNRRPFTMKAPAHYPTFNSIADNPHHGDERNFVQVKPITHTGPGGWTDELDVTEGDTFWMRVYVTNSASPSIERAAENTRVCLSIPSAVGTSLLVSAQISSTNTDPAAVWSAARLRSTTPIRLGYHARSATWYNNHHPDGTPLPDDIIQLPGALIGTEQLDGRIPSAEHYDGTIVAKLTVLGAKTSLASLTYTTRFTPADPWQPTLDITGPGIQYHQVAYRNIGDTVHDNVTVAVTLPHGLKLIPGTTTLKNSNHPDGDGLHVATDAITTTGIGIGAYTPNANAFVRFAVTSELTNEHTEQTTHRAYAHVTVDGVTRQAYTDIRLKNH